MKRILSSSAAAAALLFVSAPASAATFIVDAAANSVSRGTGLMSLVLAAGQRFTVSSSTDDLWSAGGLPRWSDANGLIADRFKTATDDAVGAVIGERIGRDYNDYTKYGLTAPVGSLVAQIGTTFMLLGANGTFVAPEAGTMRLFYWDSNNADNQGSINFDIDFASSVPEPATWGMMILGFGAVGAGLRRRSTKVRYA